VISTQQLRFTYNITRATLAHGLAVAWPACRAGLAGLRAQRGPNTCSRDTDRKSDCWIII